MGVFHEFQNQNTCRKIKRNHLHSSLCRSGNNFNCTAFILITGKSHKKDTSPVSVTTYSPGVYTSSIVLASNPVDIEVVVDDTQIKSVNLVNPSESVETMYPLISSSLSDIASQVIKNNSTENITYSQDARYTSIVLIGAINDALEKAKR